MLMKALFILENLVADITFSFLMVMDCATVHTKTIFILEILVADLAFNFLAVMNLASVSAEVNFILASLAANLTFGFLAVMNLASVRVEVNFILQNLVADVTFGLRLRKVLTFGIFALISTLCCQLGNLTVGFLLTMVFYADEGFVYS